MYKKNRTGLQVATTITSLDPPQPDLCILVRGVYRLTPGQPLEKISDQVEQGLLSGDTWHEDDPDREGELLHASDFADYKAGTDILLTGHCHAPGGAPTESCFVRVAITKGNVPVWAKRLLVSGQRTRLPDGKFGPPAPFTTMPLTWAQAFGGPEFATNPVGKGHSKNDDQAPTVMYPREGESARDARTPASFTAINPEWPQRRGKRGRNYGEEWKRERRPFYSDDFDWSYFRSAPDDQQLEGYLRGDESLTLHHVHADAAEVTVALPGTRPRVFVKDDEANQREVAMNLDTVHVFPDDGRIVIAWRGLTNCREQDYTDVTHLVIDEEPLDAPLPDEHYGALMEELEADPLCVKDHIPPELAEQWEEFQKIGPPGTNEVVPGATSNPVSDVLKAQMGGNFPAQQAQVESAMSQMSAGWGEVPPGMEGWDPLNGMVANGITPAPPAAMSPHMGIARVLSALGKLKQGMTQAFPDNLDDLAPIDEAINHPELQKFAPPPGADPAAGSMPELPGEDASAAPGAPGGPDAPNAAADPDDDAMRTGVGHKGFRRDLSGTDFSNQDLTHEDFTDCGLVGCDFTNANVAGVSFVGADLSYAVMFRVIGTGAVFTEADMSFVVADESDLDYCEFTEARLEQTGFRESRLNGAIFDKAKAVNTRFHKAELSNSSFRNLQGEVLMFDGATLVDADFTGAVLGKSVFHDVVATRVCLEDTDIRGLQAGVGADLTEARIAGAMADGSVWRDATLVQADFTDASLQKALFAGANCIGAVFRRADLSGSMMRKASLEKAQFLDAKLTRVEMPFARCIDTAFVNCNLFEAVLVDAVIANCEFAGTDRSRAIIDP